MSSEVAELEARVSQLESKLERILSGGGGGRWLDFEQFFEHRLRAPRHAVQCDEGESCPANAVQDEDARGEASVEAGPPPFALLAFRGRVGGRTKKGDASSHIFLAIAERNKLRFVAEDGTTVAWYDAGDRPVTAIFASSDGSQLVTLSEGGGARIHDVVVTYRDRFFAGSREPLRRRSRGRRGETAESGMESDVEGGGSGVSSSSATPPAARRRVVREPPAVAKLKLEVEFSGTEISTGKTTYVAQPSSASGILCFGNRVACGALACAAPCCSAFLCLSSFCSKLHLS